MLGLEDNLKHVSQGSREGEGEENGRGNCMIVLEQACICVEDRVPMGI